MKHSDDAGLFYSHKGQGKEAGAETLNCIPRATDFHFESKEDEAEDAVSREGAYVSSR